MNNRGQKIGSFFANSHGFAGAKIAAILVGLVGLKFFVALFASNAGRAAIGDGLYARFPIGRFNCFICFVILIGAALAVGFIGRYLHGRHRATAAAMAEAATREAEQRTLEEEAQAMRERQRRAKTKIVETVKFRQPVPCRKAQAVDAFQALEEHLIREIKELTVALGLERDGRGIMERASFREGPDGSKHFDGTGPVFGWRLHREECKWKAIEFHLQGTPTRSGLNLVLDAAVAMHEVGDPSPYSKAASPVDLYGKGKEMVSQSYSESESVTNSKHGGSHTVGQSTTTNRHYVDYIRGPAVQDLEAWASANNDAMRAFSAVQVGLTDAVIGFIEDMEQTLPPESGFSPRV